MPVQEFSGHRFRKRNFPIIAKTNIATFLLTRTCDYRIFRVMDNAASKIIDALGGTTAVAKMTEAPVSTVHSWRKNGIPASRLAHLKLVAQAKNLPVNIEGLAA